jgi:RNA polymerase sigma factor (sigma-70 family)
MPDERPTAAASGNNPYYQWVDSLKRGDPEAWKQIIKFHGGELRYEINISLRRRGMSAELTDDIEQQTWETAISAIRNFEFKTPDKLDHWLRVISLNHVRKMKRDLERQVSIDDFEDSTEETELEQFYAQYGLYNQGVEERIILHERMIVIDYALRQLKPQESEIFLRWLMGEKPRELAIHYNKRPQTISMILMRTKQKIKDQLEDSDGSQGDHNA